MDRKRTIIVGVGGAGGSMVRMIVEEKAFEELEYICVDTDRVCIRDLPNAKKLLIGEDLTNGRGTGFSMERGEQSARQALPDIMYRLRNYDQVVLVYGSGGGTGGGAVPVIAEQLKNEGIPTAIITTRPFAFESDNRSKIADESIEKVIGLKMETYTINLAELAKCLTAKITRISEFSRFCALHAVGKILMDDGVDEGYVLGMESFNVRGVAKGVSKKIAAYKVEEPAVEVSRTEPAAATDMSSGLTLARLFEKLKLCFS